MRRWALVSGTLTILLLGLLTWREWAHRGELTVRAERITALETTLAERTESLTGATGRAEASESRVAALELEQQTLTDRLTNLEAQRDHLRAEADRQAERARKAELAIAEAHARMEEARRDLLAATALPRQLRAQLDQAQARVAELEHRLDTGQLASSHQPEGLEIAGVASDGKVVAVSGMVPSERQLPFPVYLCKRDRVVLEAWIARMEDGLAIGHVEKWHDPASTLVKGEKVFILPKHRP